MGTVHANSAREALTRVENMVGMAGMPMTAKMMRSQIASAINVVVQVSRLVDGRRKVVSIQEVTGMEGETISMQEIFGFRQTGIGGDGTVQGAFGATGVRPKFSERVQAYGTRLSEHLFDPGRRYD